MWPFGKGNSKPASNGDASPDLSQSVENPDLVAALSSHEALPSEYSWHKLVAEIHRANYLVALLDDETNIKFDPRHGGTIKKGSRLAILFCENDQQQRLLTLFTDWGEIRAFTNQRVSAWVMPAEQVWRFLDSELTYDGVVINPAGSSLELDRHQIALIQQTSGDSANHDSVSAGENTFVQNSQLVDLLDRVQSEPDLRLDIYALLTQSTLVLGSREPVTTPQSQHTLLTTVSPSGETALPVFTDSAALGARNNEAYPVGMAAGDLFSLVIEGAYDGVVLNPASNWIYIPRDDIETFSLYA